MAIWWGFHTLCIFACVIVSTGLVFPNGNSQLVRRISMASETNGFESFVWPVLVAQKTLSMEALLSYVSLELEQCIKYIPENEFETTSSQENILVIDVENWKNIDNLSATFKVQITELTLFKIPNTMHRNQYFSLKKEVSMKPLWMKAFTNLASTLSTSIGMPHSRNPVPVWSTSSTAFAPPHPVPAPWPLMQENGRTSSRSLSQALMLLYPSFPNFK